MQPYVKVFNANTEQHYEWTKEKFIDRLFLMKEMYYNYESAEEEWDLPFVSIAVFCLYCRLELFLFALRIKIRSLKICNAIA